MRKTLSSTHQKVSHERATALPVLRNESGPTATVMGIIAHSGRGFNFFTKGGETLELAHSAYPRPLCLMGDEGFKKLSPLLGSSGARNLVAKSGRAPLHFFVLLLTSFGSAPLSPSIHAFSRIPPRKAGHGPTLLIDRSIHHSYSLLPSPSTCL